jgi:hypothetical protein
LISVGVSVIVSIVRRAARVFGFRMFSWDFSVLADMAWISVRFSVRLGVAARFSAVFRLLGVLMGLSNVSSNSSFALVRGSFVLVPSWRLRLN